MLRIGPFVAAEWNFGSVYSRFYYVMYFSGALGMHFFIGLTRWLWFMKLQWRTCLAALCARHCVQNWQWTLQGIMRDFMFSFETSCRFSTQPTIKLKGVLGSSLVVRVLLSPNPCSLVHPWGYACNLRGKKNWVQFECGYRLGSLGHPKSSKKWIIFHFSLSFVFHLTFLDT